MDPDDDVQKIMLTFDERVRKLESLVNSIKIQHGDNLVGTRLDEDFKKIMSTLSELNQSKRGLIREHVYDYDYERDPEFKETTQTKNLSPIQHAVGEDHHHTTTSTLQRTQEPDFEPDEEEEIEEEITEEETDEEWTLRARRLWSPKRKDEPYDTSETVCPPKKMKVKAQLPPEARARPFNYAKEVQQIMKNRDVATSQLLSSTTPTIPKGWEDEDGTGRIHFLKQKKIMMGRRRKKKRKKKIGKRKTVSFNTDVLQMSPSSDRPEEKSKSFHHRRRPKSSSTPKSHKKPRSFQHPSRHSEWRKIISPTKPLPLGLFAANTMSFEAKKSLANFIDDGREKKLLLTNIFKDRDKDFELTRKRIAERTKKRKKRFVSYSSVRHLTGDHSKMNNVDHYLNLCSTKYSKNVADQDRRIFVRWAGQRTRKDDLQM